MHYSRISKVDRPNHISKPSNEVFLNYGKEINNFFDQTIIGVEFAKQFTTSTLIMLTHIKKNVPTTFLKTNVFWFSAPTASLK
jgi:hypothetical protein